jgi:hypothetical protein
MNGVERLHYFNGQRLVARDLELEQHYHMQVRRILNAGLYAAGVVNGLTVTMVDGRHVRVSEGVGLDPGGRELIALSDVTLAVPNRAPVSSLPGYLLVMRYAEQSAPGVRDDCQPGVGTTPPSRTRETPVYAFTETWPDHTKCGDKGHAADCAIVLALVLLDAGCKVVGIEPCVRQIAHSEVPGQATPFALEGEKDIDVDNPKRLHFQIRNGIADAVVLYLWGGAVSSLWYTELGSHTHAINGVAVGDTAADLGFHTHNLPGGPTSDDGEHSHRILAAGQDPPNEFTKFDALLTLPDTTLPPSSVGPYYAYGPEGAAPNWNYIRLDGTHHHTVADKTSTVPNPDVGSPHHHSLTGDVALAGNTAPATGSTPYQARGGPAHSYPAAVRVRLDGTDITGLILAKLGWSALGDGTGTHLFVTGGTGGVDLLQLGLPVGVGGHQLDIRVPSGGGKILYNLYVE